MTRQSISMEDRWLSVDEICVYLGVKRDTVYNWITGKKMPAHKLGRLWKFQKDEINEWVRNFNCQRSSIERKMGKRNVQKKNKK